MAPTFRRSAALSRSWWNSPGRARSPVRLRTYLLALVAIALLPVLAVSGVTIMEVSAAYRRASEDRLLDTARALAVPVERGVEAHITALEVLATNPLLDLNERGEFISLPSFHERAVRAAAILRSPVVLFGSDGRIILHSARPFGTTLPMTDMPDAVRRVVETRRLLVSNLGFGAVRQVPVVPVLVPVERGGRVVAVLDAPILPANLSGLLAEQGLSAGRYAEVVDGNGAIVARSSQAGEALGHQAGEWLLHATAGKVDGLLDGQSPTTPEPVVQAFRRVNAAPGWVVLVGEPYAMFAIATRLPLLVFGIGGGSVLLLALACAAWIGRQVLRDVSRLETQAEALITESSGGRLSATPPRRPSATSATTVSEFAHLGEAMLRADRALRDREERQMLLVREVDHRAKNALAVVQAMVRLTPGGDPKTFQHAVQGRVDTLARTHSTLAKHGWRATDLGVLLEAEMAPYRDVTTLSGPPIAVTAIAAQPIAMVVHELATNAAKHGALSVSGGTVSVTWWVRDGDLHLRWAEYGGPVVTGPPGRRGFGTRMIEANVKGQLDGAVRMFWAPAFGCEISVPLQRVIGKHRASGAAA